MPKAIISVLGQDRPGIIAAISRILFEQACNIENISQTILQTEFAGTFIVSVPAKLSLEILNRLLDEELKPMGMVAHVKEAGKALSKTTQVPSDPFVITTRGPDRKGLVAGITQVLAQHRVNVTNLQAVFKGGSDPNNNIMIYEVDIPKAVDHGMLYRELKARAAELDLNINIQHRKIFETINRI